MQKPVLAAKEEVEEKECPQFKCISTRPHPPFTETSKPKCPPVACPPGYTPEYDDLDVANKHECPKYECKPPPPPDVICNVTGRTFNTFDRIEYKYDICNHVLARDVANDNWDVSCKSYYSLSFILLIWIIFFDARFAGSCDHRKIKITRKERD